MISRGNVGRNASRKQVKAQSSQSQLKPALNVRSVITVSLVSQRFISTHMSNYNDSDLGSTVDLQYLTGKLVLFIHLTNIYYLQKRLSFTRTPLRKHSQVMKFTQMNGQGVSR